MFRWRESTIVIRAMRVTDGRVHIRAGAGIVADSVPENEWDETERKQPDMARRKEDWRKAYLNTPHGKPIELSAAFRDGSKA